MEWDDDVDRGDINTNGDRLMNSNIFGNAIYSINKNTEVGLELSSGIRIIKALATRRVYVPRHRLYTSSNFSIDAGMKLAKLLNSFFHICVTK